MWLSPDLSFLCRGAAQLRQVGTGLPCTPFGMSTWRQTCQSTLQAPSAFHAHDTVVKCSLPSRSLGNVNISYKVGFQQKTATGLEGLLNILTSGRDEMMCVLGNTYCLHQLSWSVLVEGAHPCGKVKCDMLKSLFREPMSECCIGLRGPRNRGSFLTTVFVKVFFPGPSMAWWRHAYALVYHSRTLQGEECQRGMWTWHPSLWDPSAFPYDTAGVGTSKAGKSESGIRIIAMHFDIKSGLWASYSFWHSQKGFLQGRYYAVHACVSFPTLFSRKAYFAGFSTAEAYSSSRWYTVMCLWMD